jgi:molecular chaperone HscB
VAPASPHNPGRAELANAIDRRSVPDYFELFGLPRRFAIDRAALDRRFYELSREAHPDRFATAGPEQLKSAVERMSLINEGYRTLKDPVELRQYFLSLQGFEIPAAKKAQIPAELAESWFELQDILAEDPERAVAKVTDFERKLADSRTRGANELVEIEQLIDRIAGDRIPIGELERLSNAIRAQNYLASLERDVERIAQRFGGIRGVSP